MKYLVSLKSQYRARTKNWTRTLTSHVGGSPRVVVSTAAFHARARSFPDLAGLKETKMFLPNPLVKLSIVGSLCEREVACSASDLQGLNFESCVWWTVSFHSYHHPQDVLLAQFSLYVHKSGLKPGLFQILTTNFTLSLVTKWPGALVKAACLESRRSRARTPTLAFKCQRNKMFLPRLPVKIQYCGELWWPWGSMLGLRPPGLEFWILCLEGSIISFISSSSGGSPGPV